MKEIYMPYSPKINPELVRQLYLLKHSLQPKIPMTRLVNEAVKQFLNKKTKEVKIYESGS